MNRLFIQKIYIALVLVGSLTLHYTVQAQELVHDAEPQCSSACHQIDIEICHEISLAQIVSDTPFTILDTGILSIDNETHSVPTGYTDGCIDVHRLPSYQELARSHIDIVM